MAVKGMCALPRVFSPKMLFFTEYESAVRAWTRRWWISGRMKALFSIRSPGQLVNEVAVMLCMKTQFLTRMSGQSPATMPGPQPPLKWHRVTCRSEPPRTSSAPHSAPAVLSGIPANPAKYNESNR